MENLLNKTQDKLDYKERVIREQDETILSLKMQIKDLANQSFKKKDRSPLQDRSSELKEI